MAWPVQRGPQLYATGCATWRNSRSSSASTFALSSEVESECFDASGSGIITKYGWSDDGTVSVIRLHRIAIASQSVRRANDACAASDVAGSGGKGVPLRVPPPRDKGSRLVEDLGPPLQGQSIRTVHDIPKAKRKEGRSSERRSKALRDQPVRRTKAVNDDDGKARPTMPCF